MNKTKDKKDDSLDSLFASSSDDNNDKNNNNNNKKEIQKIQLPSSQNKGTNKKN